MAEPELSGVDLARSALLAARAAAKNAPTQPQKKRTGPGRRITRTGGRDPIGLAAAITSMMGDRGWEPPEPGGSILDQWPTIAPELVGKVAAERYEHDTGVLHLRPASPAYATQLRLHQTQILRTIHEKTGGQSVRALRILTPGTPALAAEPSPEQRPAAVPEAPVKTRQDGCPGYQDAIAVALEHRPPTPPVDPYVEEAMRRQEAALRANRQPETEHRDAEWAQDTGRPAAGSVEESLARARAYARTQRAGQTPRRAFDVA
ncbi:DciA family protein [Streptomyces cylindrosporus]|uniref:DciA family protein n=1 Tax=Streptomyces cylindrosporus TaxID=2927583 RepID=A0ABS9YSE1_9ACTN|nr:DciA family protein [Streptomyces cylindrosporus]MCI3279181.1 DciA family protein [Streptomyces cylindrosporus]